MSNMSTSGGLNSNAAYETEISEILNALQGVTTYDNVRASFGKTYKAHLLQTGEAGGAPTASEVINTTGATITWTNIDVGIYNLSASTTVFTTGDTKLFCNAHLGAPLSQSVEASLHLIRSGSSTSALVMKCYNTGSVLVDGFEGFVEFITY